MIAATDAKIDVIFIGPNDLHNSMGKPQEGDQLFTGQPLVRIFDPSQMVVDTVVGEPDGAARVDARRLRSRAVIVVGIGDVQRARVPRLHRLIVDAVEAFRRLPVALLLLRPVGLPPECDRTAADVMWGNTAWRRLVKSWMSATG